MSEGREGEGGRKSRVGRVLRRALLPLVILGAAIGAASYLRATKPDIPRQELQERVWVVSAKTVRFSTVEPELVFYGQIVAGREADLRPLVSGRVVEVGPNFVEGGFVRRDELLIAVDRFNFESAVAVNEALVAEAQAKIAELQADLEAERSLLERDRELVELREREVARRRDLRKAGTGSQKSLDDSLLALSEQRQRLTTREQSILRLKARINQQQAVLQRLRVNLGQARRDLSETRLEAPFDGFVVGVETTVGKLVNTGDKIARLIDADWLEARFHMADSDYARLSQAKALNKREATVIWRTADRDIAFDARIERVSGRFEASSGGVELYARVLGGEATRLLRPGAFVEVHVKDRTYERVARLPRSAVHGDGVVYVVESGRLAGRSVTVRGRAGDDLLVDGALETGDRVVTTAFAEIGPGVRVSVP